MSEVQQPTNFLQHLVYIVVATAGTLLIVRLILGFFGANPANSFAQTIYQWTTPLVTPFVGLFPAPTVIAPYLDIATVCALVAVSLLGWLLSLIAGMLGR